MTKAQLDMLLKREDKSARDWVKVSSALLAAKDDFQKAQENCFAARDASDAAQAEWDAEQSSKG